MTTRWGWVGTCGPSGPCAWPGMAGRSAVTFCCSRSVRSGTSPSRILTNSNTGWRLIQDVERAALQSYLGATFAKNQAISHRGLVETLPSVEPLASQPDPAPYLGNYRRPMNTVAVRLEGGRLIVQVTPRSGDPQAAMPVSFYGSDRAVVTEGNDKGQSIEFLRDASGQVKWIRVTGRVAVREQ